MTLTKNLGSRFLSRFFSTPSVNYRDSAAIFLPILAENAFITLFGLINTSMISSAGMASLTAVSIVDTLNFFLQTIYMGIATGAGVVVAGYRGLGDNARLHEASVQAVLLVTLTASFTTLLICLFNRPMLLFLFDSAEADVMAHALLYMFGGALSLPFMAATNAIGAVLRGIGEGRTQLFVTITNSIMYFLLNLLFLVVLNMGILGLVISIAINRVAGLLVSLLFRRCFKSSFRFKLSELLHLNFSIIKKMLFVGLPAALEQLFFNGGRLITQRFVVPMGTNSAAAFNISYNLMMFTQIFSLAINQTMYTLVGICVGTGRTDDVRKLSRSYISLNIILYALFIPVFFLAFDTLLIFYNAPPDIVSTIYLCVLITMIAQPLIHSQTMTMPAILRAAGDGIFCTITSLSTMWLFRVTFGWLLGVVLGWGVLGIWLGMIIDWLARAVIFQIRYLGKAWEKKSAYMKDK